MDDAKKIEVVVASEEHVKYVDEILDTINRAAKVRGTGRRCNKLHSTICIVLLSEFVSQNVWVQHLVHWPGNSSL